ncbi:MAG TPA: FHA domain-containing protein [Phototrophicaceae bacterium]|nr:FHA domain-containing protein [Phototrophicaceae bacterium]
MSTTQSRPPGGSWGNESIEPHEYLILYIVNHTNAIVLPRVARLVLGRTVTAEQGFDLTPYKAEQKGVSRAHAAIEISGTQVTLTDLSSTNGTYLNNNQLKPHQPQLIRSGDQIRLGELVGYIYFSSP